MAFDHIRGGQVLPLPWNWDRSYLTSEAQGIVQNLIGGFVPGFGDLSAGRGPASWVETSPGHLTMQASKYGKLLYGVGGYYSYVDIRNDLGPQAADKSTTLVFSRPSSGNTWDASGGPKDLNVLMTGDGGILIKDDHGSGPQIRLAWWTSSGIVQHYFDSFLPTDDSWQCIVITHLGTIGRCFLQGAFQGSHEQTFGSMDNTSPNPGKMRLIADDGLVGFHFGQNILGAVYFWDRILSDAEIAAVSADPFMLVRHYKDTSSSSVRVTSLDLPGPIEGRKAISAMPKNWNWSPAYVAPEWRDIAEAIGAGYVPGFAGLSRQGCDFPEFVNNSNDPILWTQTEYGRLLELREVTEPYDTFVRLRNRLTNSGRQQHTGFFFGKLSDENTWATNAVSQSRIVLFGGSGGKNAGVGFETGRYFNASNLQAAGRNLGTALADDQTWHSFAHVVKYSRWWHYVDGKLEQANDGPTVTLIPPDDTGEYNGDMALGKDAEGDQFGGYPAGVIYGACYVFMRALTDDEIVRLSADPWGPVRHYRDTTTLAYKVALALAIKRRSLIFY